MAVTSFSFSSRCSKAQGSKRGRCILAVFLLLVQDQVHAFVHIGGPHDTRIRDSITRIHVGSNDEDYREELKSLTEKQTQNAVVDALFADGTAAVSSTYSSSSLVSLELLGQARLSVSKKRSTDSKAAKKEETVSTLILSNQQQPQKRKFFPRRSDSLSLLVPLASKGQLKLVSFAAAQRPLSKSVLLGLNPLLVNRDNALFDNLPWASWSVDPQQRNRDAAGNFVDPKFHLGKRDAYNRFMGKDWQGRSLAIGNMALRLKYMLESTDDDDSDEENSYKDNTPKEDDDNSSVLAIRILQLQQRELRMELADVDSQLAVARNNDMESVPALEKSREWLQDKLEETSQDIERIVTAAKEEEKEEETFTDTITAMIIDTLDKIVDWTTDGGKNAAPYRGAMGYAPILDSKEDIDESLLPYTSPYDLLKEIIDDQLNAKVIGCVLENASLLKGTTVIGGAVVLQRKTPTKTVTLAGEQVEYNDYDEDFGNKIQGGETMIVECEPDEAVGVALTYGVPIKAESAVFDRSSLMAAQVSSSQQSENIMDFLSIWKPSDPSVSFEIEGDNSTATNPSPISIPRTTNSLYDSLFEEDKPKGSSMFPRDNPIKSLSQFDSLSNEGKAKTLLEMSNFNGRLPRPRVVRNSDPNPLDGLLLPLIDESVRRQYKIRDAEKRGDTQLVAELKQSESRYQKAREQAEAAKARGDDNADEWESEAEFLASLRADVTQDEGAYSRFLDRDDWYERERRATAKRVKKSSFGTLLDGIE